MRMISKEALQALRERFPMGTRVELLQMDDPQAPPIGTKGTVRGVDDIGSIMVAWDNGYGLSVIWGEDECRVLFRIVTQMKMNCCAAYTLARYTPGSEPLLPILMSRNSISASTKAFRCSVAS